MVIIMLKAYYDNMLIGVTNEFIFKNGKYFFPRTKINFSLLKKSKTHINSPHLGIANFYNLETDRIYEKDIAWYYPKTDETVKELENFITFNNKITFIKN
jgi:uncharacterized protein (DUF427 family)